MIKGFIDEHESRTDLASVSDTTPQRSQAGLLETVTQNPFDKPLVHGTGPTSARPVYPSASTPSRPTIRMFLFECGSLRAGLREDLERAREGFVPPLALCRSPVASQQWNASNPTRRPPAAPSGHEARHQEAASLSASIPLRL